MNRKTLVQRKRRPTRMQERRILLLILGLLILGCASRAPVVLEAIGPAPNNQDVAEASLLVFTPIQPYGKDGPRLFTGYRIYSSDGKLQRDIHSNGGIDVVHHEPRTITLPPGEYVVEAEAEAFAVVQVPVVIEERRLTVVHLTRDSSRSLTDGDPQSWVRLPDGQAAGWRATSR